VQKGGLLEEVLWMRLSWVLVHVVVQELIVDHREALFLSLVD